MKKRILFVCLGNICRSPMAEAMARKYGSDVIDPSSAGLTPQLNNHLFTRSVLKEKNVELGEHVPRGVRDLDLRQFDLIVNMSGRTVPKPAEVPMEEWTVEDPYGKTEEDFRTAREAIEMLVMRLILRVRLGKF